MEKLSTDRKTLQHFALVMGSALGAIGTVFVLKHKPAHIFLYGGALGFLIPGLLFARILAPLYIVWMRLAFVLSWINTRLLLTVIYYGIITPLAWGMSLAGKDPLRRKLERQRESYWKKMQCAPFKPSDYERQY